MAKRQERDQERMHLLYRILAFRKTDTIFHWYVAKVDDNAPLAWIALLRFFRKRMEKQQGDGVHFAEDVVLPAEMADFLLEVTYGLAVLATGQDPFSEHADPLLAHTVMDHLPPGKLAELVPRVLKFTAPGKNDFATAGRLNSSPLAKIRAANGYASYRAQGFTAQEAFRRLEYETGEKPLSDSAWFRRIREGETLMKEALKLVDQREVTAGTTPP